MAARISSPSPDGSTRKRVCKACDRCRLKKSKCDGAKPCSRCKADNSICVFGERKRIHERSYPKGYVERLEQQQVWLVHGLQELYRCLNEGKAWSGDHLDLEPNGHPLTHDLLTRLGALDHGKGDRFEENIEALQRDPWGGDMRQESPNDSSHAKSPVAPQCFSPGTSSQRTSFSTPEIESPLNNAPIARQPTEGVSQYNPSSIQDDIDPLYLLNESASWQANDTFSLFDEMDMMSTADYSNLVFSDSTTSRLLSRQMPINCITSSVYGEDYQVFNTNSAEITLI
ncbi:hypothetical protein N7520_009897 [Penicillium odoratum]|uniref:uncharacterized protein n=1 Tax=Penicillium odoratum TaxID=1167516 RepID=UPI0025468407|nr:uncharacterized protein N7520_009897 [Penicillium odoratum]KAJ5752980.1 hypothetical protein N7520_009897 [Penicillium odoratum]